MCAGPQHALYIQEMISCSGERGMLITDAMNKYFSDPTIIAV